MPNCSVVGCGLQKSSNRPNISLHRLPKNYKRKKMWLDAIGIENLKSHTKSIFVCSLHFEESCFNKTFINVVLRDDAVPSKLFIRSAQSSSSHTSTEINRNQALPTTVDDAFDKSPIPNIVDVEWKLEVVTNSPGAGSDNLIYTVVLKTDSGKDIRFTCGTQQLQDLVYKLKDLVKHCENQRNELA